MSPPSDAELVEQVDRLHPDLEPAVLERHRDRHLTAQALVARLEVVEHGAQGELEILQRLERQVEPERDPATTRCATLWNSGSRGRVSVI